MNTKSSFWRALGWELLDWARLSAAGLLEKSLELLTDAVAFSSEAKPKESGPVDLEK